MEFNNASFDDIPHDVPGYVWTIIHELILGVNNKTLDPGKPHLRPSVAQAFSFIVFVYVVLIFAGVFSNLAVLFHIVRRKLYVDPTYCFLLNNAISDLFKCVCVLPISVYVLLVHNWILGELLCSFLPMMQDIPLHTTTLTFLLIAYDRLRLVRHPTKPRLPGFVCTVGTWLTSLCLVLPYPIYIIYIDLGKYVAAFKDVGLCIVNLSDNMLEYMRGIFLIMYAGPLATISYLHVRISRELESHQSSSAVVIYEARSREARPRTDSHSTTTDFRPSRGELDTFSQNSRGSFRDRSSSTHHHYGRHDSDDLDVVKERRTQKYMCSIVTSYAVCLCPLMILRLARLALVETYENTGHFDITYLVFTWLAFLPVCLTPLLFALWQMSRCAKERLRGYFRISNRKLRQSCETVISTAGTPAAPRRSHKTRHDGAIQLAEEAHSDSNSYLQESSSS